MIELLCRRCSYPPPAHAVLGGLCPIDGDPSSGYRLIDTAGMTPEERRPREAG